MRMKPVILCLSSCAALATASQVKYTSHNGQEIQQTVGIHIPDTTS